MTTPLNISSYYRLEADQVSLTASALLKRVNKRFPASGLSKVSLGLLSACRATSGRLDRLLRPFWPLRSLSYTLIFALLALITFGTMTGIQWDSGDTSINFGEFVMVLEPLLSSVVFLGAFILFVWTLEQRWKQRQVQKALNELRSIAHIIDMHQLRKDPESSLSGARPSEPLDEPELTIFEMGRYLDYCSELLSIVSKISALYAQSLPEQATLSGVDQVEALATGLSRKIWQKIMLLHSIPATEAREAPPVRSS